MAKVSIPTPLQRLTENNALVEVGGKTVSEVIDELDGKHPGIKEKLFKEGKLNRFINIYVDGEDIRFKQGLDTKISEDTEVSIIPAISGG